MNILHTPQAAVGLEPVQRFVLGCISWEDYEKFLDAVGERHVRVTYDRGTLELMTLSPNHELYKVLFGRLLDMLMIELDVPLKALGSTTFRREDVEGGLEPDQCYYLGSLARVHSWSNLNLAVDPPPDLAIEIEITRRAVDRMHIYAGLGVPEVWRFDGERLVANRLQRDGGYAVVPRSVELPFLPLDEIPPLFRRSLQYQEDRALVRGLLEWVRTRVLPLRQASAGKRRRRKTEG